MGKSEGHRSRFCGAFLEPPSTGTSSRTLQSWKFTWSVGLQIPQCIPASLVSIMCCVRYSFGSKSGAVKAESAWIIIDHQQLEDPHGSFVPNVFIARIGSSMPGPSKDAARDAGHVQ